MENVVPSLLMKYMGNKDTSVVTPIVCSTHLIAMISLSLSLTHTHKE
jgi:hypothetical protein